MMHERRKARELALQTLYACEMGNDQDIDTVLRETADRNHYTGETRRYGGEIARAALGSRGKIDGRIQKHTANWDVKRLASIDRNILRLAVAELLFFRDVPYKVVIDEAVEIAKKYGAEDSSKFVNGIIDSIYREMQEKK